MARPREFEESEVLDTALGVFWSKGYDRTTIQDLVDATGLERASLYGAFGDKQQFFQRAIARYLERLSAELRALEDEPSARRGIESLFASRIASTCPSSGPRGCFLLLAGMTSNAGDSWARDLLAESLKQTEASLRRAIRRGQTQNEITKHRDATSLARLLLVTLQGLSTAARAGWNREKLRGVADEALAHLDVA